MFEEHGPPIEFTTAGDTPEEQTTNLKIVRPSPGFDPASELCAEAIIKDADVTVLDFSPQQVTVRFQIDGLWHAGTPMDREMGDYMLATLKQLAGVDYRERRERQTGNFASLYLKKKQKFKLVSQGIQTGERVALYLDYKRPPLVFKTSGSFTFPAQEFIWWNESAKQLETVELPQQTFEVLATEIAPESSATEINDNQSSKPKSQSLPAWIAASLFLVVALYLSRHWTNMKYHELLSAPFIQERKTFRALVAAAQSKNIDETMHRLYRWTDFPLHDCDAPQIRVLLERFGSASDTIQIQKLLSGESSGNWNSDDFIRACRSIRKNWRHNKVQVDQQQTSALPKLNP